MRFFDNNVNAENYISHAVIICCLKKEFSQNKQLKMCTIIFKTIVHFNFVQELTFLNILMAQKKYLE